MNKAAAWKKFSEKFLSRLSDIDPSLNLNEAFAHPVKGSKAEAVIISMRSAFGDTFEAADGVIEKAQPSTAWDDDDFRE